ncbi:WD domain-containing protein [Colletotrichum higginsianum IMI 349063]|uniref:WD domain-containing protein n=3 Tax=Colletotrichum destructivum species complex TaxID=2707350 RepID=A0A1B7YPB9_COLHI|nr:WD domain-containing protein [Colletotrichum higginsianum IMI 349063]OBR13905.1 WD domain-containing protein [Colletotrichum higginsianum IMI 349063]TID02179.1 Transcriptional repressor rco-1 [Colletotrichum higginsianum]
MSMYPHRAMGAVPPNNSARLNELLDQIRTEFDTQLRQTEGYEHQIQSQVQEMQLVREKVYAMEQAQMNLKQKYEEEIAMLRRQLEGARGNAPPSIGGPPPHAGPSQQPPSITPGTGLFNGIMTGGGQAQLAPPPPPPPPQDQQMGPQHQMAQGPPGLPGPPPPPPQSQQPFPQYPQGPGGPVSNGLGSQPPQTTASPGPGRRGIGRPPAAVGPATPQINTPIPFPGTTQSPQVSHPTPDHARMGGPHAPPVGNALGDLDPDRLPPHSKKSGHDWFVIFNQHVPRMLDVDLVHTLAHESVVCCVRFSHDGKYVATGCNRSAQIYDVQSGEKLCVLQDDTVDITGDLYIRSVCFSPDGKYLATGAEDKLIRVWDIQSRQIRNTFSGHEQDIYSLDFARDGRTIASGSGDRTVRLWDIEQGTNTLTLTIEDGVTTVAISPDTKYVAAGSLDKSVRVWDIHQGYLLERLEGPDGHKDSVYSVAFSPNGRDLVSGSLDKTIKMWELSTPRGLPNPGPKGGRCVKTFEGHRDFVLSVALTPDAAWVMSGSKDRGVQFWDPRTGATQLMLQGHKNSVISVAPSPTGGYFATGSGDMRARIWSYRSVQ